MEGLNEYLNETPIVVKFWETELDRDEGLSEIYGYYPESQKAEAIQAGKKLMHRMDYACVEVYNEETEETYYWTDGVTEDYYDNKNMYESLNIDAPVNFEYGKYKGIIEPNGDVTYNKGTSKNNTRYKFNYNDKSIESDFPHTDNQVVRNYIKTNILNEYAKKITEATQEDIIAKKYGLTPYLDKLTQDLMNLQYVTKVDYDLSGYYDNINGPITLVSYDIPNTEVTTKNYLEIKKDLKTQVLDVMKNNGVNVELEEFEDNDTYFYIVAYSTNWNTVIKEEEAVNHKTKLTFAYKDNGQFYYKDKNGKVYVDMSPLKDKIDLYRCVGDYDEPANSVNVEEYELINNPKDNINYDRNKNYEADYMLLGRLVQDCKYYLGNGNRFDGNLWAGSVDKQIAKMKELWNKFPEDMKPEWLSMEDIENYEKEMTTEKKTERRVLGEYKSIKNEDTESALDKNTNLPPKMLKDAILKKAKELDLNVNKVNNEWVVLDGDNAILYITPRRAKQNIIDRIKLYTTDYKSVKADEFIKALKADNLLTEKYSLNCNKIITEDIESANKDEIYLYKKFIDGIKENLNINEYDIQKDGNAIKFRYNDNVYFAEPCSMYQVNIFDSNHNQIGWGVLVNEIKEEVFTEYTNDDYLYQLVGGKYAGTYTREEAGNLPILEPELTGENNGRRKELQKQLQFKGYLGPMWNGTKDGKAIIRYETQEVYDMLSENKLVEETDKEMYKRIKEEPRTDNYKQGLKLRDEIVDAWKNKNLELAYNKWSELFDLFSTGYDNDGNKTSEWTEEQSMRDMIELTMITHTIEDKCVYDVCDYGKAKAYKEMGY